MAERDTERLHEAEQLLTRGIPDGPLTLMEFLDATVAAQPFVAIRPGLYLDLCRELDDAKSVVLRYLIALASKHLTPIAINVPGKSKTHVIAPTGWTKDRVAGWCGTRLPLLQVAFGTRSINELSLHVRGVRDSEGK